MKSALVDLVLKRTRSGFALPLWKSTRNGIFTSSVKESSKSGDARFGIGWRTAVGRTLLMRLSGKLAWIVGVVQVGLG